MSIKEFQVEDDSMDRLDVFIANRIDSLSRNEIQTLIKDGLVLVDNRKRKASYPVKKDEKILVDIPEEEELEMIAEDLNLEIIYEDDYLAIVNKEIGMVVHPSPGHESGTLANGLLYEFDRLSDENGKFRPGIVHRLDKDTSGLLVIAKDNKTHKYLAKQFKERTVKRIYKALVFGRVSDDKGMINAPIGRHPVNRQKMAVTMENSREAITEYEVLERFDKYSLLKLSLTTGRTHQLRVHMNYLNYPIVGDPIYSNGSNEFKIDKQFLHSVEIGFKHPKNGKEVFFKTDKLPERSEEILTALRNRRDS